MSVTKVKVTPTNVGGLIEKHRLEIDPPSDDEECYWSIFPTISGGHWSDGDTLIEAVQACIEENKL